MYGRFLTMNDDERDYTGVAFDKESITELAVALDVDSSNFHENPDQQITLILSNGDTVAAMQSEDSLLFDEFIIQTEESDAAADDLAVKVANILSKLEYITHDKGDLGYVIDES